MYELVSDWMEDEMVLRRRDSATRHPNKAEERRGGSWDDTIESRVCVEGDHRTGIHSTFESQGRRRPQTVCFPSRDSLGPPGISTDDISDVARPVYEEGFSRL